VTDEARLLDAWRGGDQAAGQTLFELLFHPCRRLFVNKVPERDIEDLLQQTFAAVLEARDRFRGDSSFKTYALGIARRVLFRYLRTFGRRDAKHTHDLNVSSIAAMGVTPGTVLAVQEQQAAVRLALQRIPVQFQAILELSYWEGLGNDELAQVFSIDRTTVRTRLFRARKALAGVLEGKLPADEESIARAVRDVGKEI
jgi:RNA polymerase sigma-70 factor (ECF subfamily)